jgi:hypothetical protein
MPGDRRHWFDRLSERSTRREALKATALAGAALALPLERAAPAHAATVLGEKCTKACLYTAGVRYDHQKANCASGVGADGLVILFGGAIGIIFGTASAAAALHCQDSALVQEKADSYDCLAPGCGSFDPTKAGGPCDTCTQNCCFCPSTSTGAICCFYPCDGPTSCCPGG